MSSMFDQYRRELDSLRFSDEALERMAARLKKSSSSTEKSVIAAATSSSALRSPLVPVMKSSAVQPKLQTKRSVRRLLRIAASFAIAVGLGLGATGAYAVATQRSLPAVFSDIFGGAPAQTEVIERIGRPIGASATSNGITVTADAVIGSSNSCVIVFSISRDDGRSLELPVPGNDSTYPLLWAANSIQIDSTQGLGSGAYFYDADPADNSIQYVYTINNATTPDGNGLAGRTARVHLSDLLAASEQASSSETIANGTWDLKFQLNYQDSSLTLQAGQKLELNDMNVTVDKLLVSPIGASITYTVDAVNTESASPGKLPSDEFVHLPFSVTFKDGRALDGTDADASTRERNGSTVVTKSLVFDTITSLDEITSVTVGDQIVPIR